MRWAKRGMRAATARSVANAADWLLAREIRRKGDWSVKRPDTEPSGWAFEFQNDWYPDIDDTAMVMLAFPHMRASKRAAQAATRQRALDWLLAMQSKDGGWAAFDVDNNWEILTHVPFADHNAMLDPTCADITGRTLEALAANGFDRSHPACQRAIDYLIRTQLADGSWYGRWGVAYIYGTCFALRGLRAMGEDDHEPYIQRANEWLRSIQNSDGGWGESCASYDNDIYTAAESTPSQTAWALMGLMAGGDTLQFQRAGWHRISGRNAERGRDVARRTGHRHGLPQGFLPQLSLLPALLPAAGAGHVREGSRQAVDCNPAPCSARSARPENPFSAARPRADARRDCLAAPIQELIASMFETMRAAPGVGLAAPQIGMHLQLAVIEDPRNLSTNFRPTYRRTSAFGRCAACDHQSAADAGRSGRGRVLRGLPESRRIHRHRAAALGGSRRLPERARRAGHDPCARMVRPHSAT